MSDKYESRYVTKEWLEENGLPYDNAGAELETEDVGRRWMDVTTCTFQAPDDGLWYQFYFDVGKTENQWCSWDEELSDPVELMRVERKEVMVYKWELVRKTA